MSKLPELPQLIALVDDDDAIRDALSWLFASRQLSIETFADPAAFLGNYDPHRYGCLLLDVRMPQLSGIELFEKLKASAYCPPTLFLTGHGDVPLAVQALKLGAEDFIEKPFDDNDLIQRAQLCLQKDGQLRMTWHNEREHERRLASLTQREREVMQLILLGRLNKVIADQLGISMKTVEVHRARVLEKMGVRSAVELAAMLKP